ncbi:MAG: tetratricopeptide repeat protein [Planctomycetes bacterium]|nr:tetratricopeptide repeat protein [Planctomycetota bacterium]
MKYRLVIVAAVAVALAPTALPGCGKQPQPQADTPTEPAEAIATNSAPDTPPGETPPPLPKEAALSLDELPDLPAPAEKTYDRELPDNAKELLADARDLRKTGDIPGAIAKAERAVGYDPNNPTIQYVLGLTYMQLPDYGKAENHLAKAAEYLGDDVELQFTLGRLALQQKDVDRAVRHFRMARVAKNANPEKPETAMATLLLAQLLERRGYFTAAVECYRRLGEWIAAHGSNYREEEALRDLLMNPEKLLVLRGRLLILLREKPRAAALLERAWQTNRSDTRTAQYLLGLRIDLGRFEEAQELLVELTAAEGVQAALPVLAERLCRQAAKPDLPAQLWERIRQRAGTDAAPADIGLRLADVAADLGSQDAGVDILQAILAEIPSNADAAQRLAAIHAAKGDYTRALTLLAETLVRNADAVPAVRTGVDEILRHDPPETLLDEFSRTTYAADGKNKYALHYVAGTLAEQLGKSLKAADHYRRAAAERKDFLPVYEALLDLYLESENEDDVAVLLDMVQDVAEDSHLYNYLLGRTELARGRLDEAIAVFEKARRQSSTHLQTLLALADVYDRKAKAAIANADWAAVSRYRAKSEEALRDAIDLRPEDLGLYRKLFDLYTRRGDLGEAEKIARDLFRTQPREYESLAMLAEIYIRTGEHDKARVVLERLRRSYGDRPGVTSLLVQGEIARNSASLPSEMFVRAGSEGFASVQQYRHILPAAVHDRVVLRLREIIKAQPTDLEAKRLLARQLGLRIPGQHTDAAKLWREIHKTSGEDADARQAILQYVHADQPDQADSFVRGLLAENENDPDLQRLLATVLAEQETYDEAIELLRNLLAGTRQDIRLITIVGALYEKAGRHEAGAEWIGSLIDDAPGELANALRHTQAVLYCKAGQFDRALPVAQAGEGIWGLWQCFDVAVESEAWDQADRFAETVLDKARTVQGETNATSILAVASELKMRLAIERGRIDRAIEIARSFADDLQGEQDPCVRLAVLLGREKNFQPAVKLLDERIEKLEAVESPSPEQLKSLTVARQSRVEMLMWRHKSDEALKAINAIIVNDPNNADLHNVRAAVLGELGKTNEAIAALERAIEIRSDDAMLQNNLAYSYAEAGRKLDRAERLAIDAIKDVGLATHIVDTLAWTYYKQAKFSEAAALLLSQLPKPDELDEAKDLGDHPIIWDHLGDTLYRLGWKHRAVRIWQVALQRGEDEDDSKDLRLVLENTPKKIQAVKDNQPAPVAPLSEAHQAKIRNATETDTPDNADADMPHVEMEQ